MKITPLGTNHTELSLNDGTRVFFSYETPVAAIVNGEEFKTEEFYSNTTSRHINDYFGGKDYAKKVTKKPQEFFDNLVKSQ